MSDPRPQLLRDSIVDIEGSIHANDNKASAALVVHGLVFAGAASLAKELGDVYMRLTELEEVVFWIAAGGALGSLLVSVLSLLAAIFPYHPRHLSSKCFKTEDVFHPAGFRGARRRPPTKLMAALDRVRDRFSGESVYEQGAASHESLLRELRRDPSVVKARPDVRTVLEQQLDRLENDLKQLPKPRSSRAEDHLAELIARLDAACGAQQDPRDREVRLYAAEVVKLMDILLRERDWTRVGVWALRLELCFVAVFVFVVTTVAASQAPG
jgi:ElaB/YqjD/DUF883 family membrane-anchored ribosome-binding protein